MQLDEMIDAMTPEVYQRLVTAVETGKWADGVALTAEQKENSLQLVLLWQAASMAGLISPRTLAAPSTVLASAWALCLTRIAVAHSDGPWLSKKLCANE